MYRSATSATRLPTSRFGSGWLWIATAVSLAVSLTPAADTALYPFRLFTTWVHEGGHALATVLVGGHVSSIVIRPRRERPDVQSGAGQSRAARRRGVGRLLRALRSSAAC